MVFIESWDLIALICSFTSMFDQLKNSCVSRTWHRMISTHPFLLWNLDFGNPLTFSLAPLQHILNLAGSRIRRLKLCDFGHFLPWNPPYHPISDISLILQPRFVHNLEFLELVGHLSSEPIITLIFTLLTKSQAPQITLRIATCSCCLDLIHRRLSNLSLDVQLESALSQLTSNSCDICGVSNRWCRRCPNCLQLHCSHCNSLWAWSNNLTKIGRLCRCRLCVSKPTWNCSVHCRLCSL